MGRASNQTYPKHVEATLRLLDRIAKKKNNNIFSSVQRISGCDWYMDSFLGSLNP
jgi:predicted RNase H-like nuclease